MKHLKKFNEISGYRSNFDFDKNEIYYHGTTEPFDNFTLGNRVTTKTYGNKAPDQGLGTFFTDNLTMAKWFAGRTEYDLDTEKYEELSGTGRVVSANLNIKKPWILNDNYLDYMSKEDFINWEDPIQVYFDIINTESGGENFKEKLKTDGYDSVIVKGGTTNYYEYPNTYDIIVVFNPSQINVISKNVLSD